MTQIDQSKNAYPLSLRFKHACLGLEDGLLGNARKEEILHDIRTVRSKIATVNWEQFDPRTPAAQDVFAFLVAIAEHTKEGLDLFIDNYGIGYSTRKNYALGTSIPSRYITERLTPALKKIVERQLLEFENALEKDEPYTGYGETFPIPLTILGFTNGCVAGVHAPSKRRL